MSTALVPYTGNAADRWRSLSEGERRRLAITACADRDLEVLWSLADAHLSTFSSAGGALSQLTRDQYRVGIRRLLAYWQHEDLRKPPRDAAAGWLRHMETQGVVGKDGTPRGMKPSSVKVYLAAARVLYAALRWAGATTVDPFADLRPARDMVAAWDKRKPYSDAQVQRLLAAAGPHDALLILLCAHAGLRVSEAVALRWEDVDLAERELTVQRGKGGKLRRVPLTRTLAGALAEARALPKETEGSGPADYLLPYRDRRTAWHRLHAVAVRAEVPYLGVHAFRHTAGTRIYRQTESVEITARMLGHQQLETSRISGARS